MSFSMQDALAVATATLASRQRSRSNAYTLYYSNDSKRYDGKFDAFTVKQAIAEFREMGGSYTYAFITRKDDSKPLRYFNRNISKKFFSLTRTRKTK